MPSESFPPITQNSIAPRLKKGNVKKIQKFQILVKVMLFDRVFEMDHFRGHNDVILTGAREVCC